MRQSIDSNRGFASQLPALRTASTLLLLGLLAGVGLGEAPGDSADEVEGQGGETGEQVIIPGDPLPVPVDSEREGALPRDAGALAAAGAQAYARAEWDKARDLFAELIEVEPQNALAHANMGAALDRLDDTEGALRHLQQAVALNPRLARVWMSMGLIHMRRDELNLALSSLARALHEEPLNAAGHNNMAILLTRLGWNIGAEQELERAIELDPTMADAHFNLAVLRLERTPPALEMARQSYQRALQFGAPADEEFEQRLEVLSGAGGTP